MSKIKIISNPYKRSVEFYTYKEASDEWLEINIKNNPDSMLLAEGLRTGFFPYKAKEVLTILEQEYGKALDILFEGTSDEFEVLKDICAEHECVNLQRSIRYIENARDILPEIVDVFSKVQPIVEKNISSGVAKQKTERDIAKFTDASNDIVPICVLGNYSSGKSTFINALIGLEILPSGDMPVTAKIYKVMKSIKNDKAEISFIYKEDSIEVEINENGYKVEYDQKNELAENELAEELETLLIKNEGKSFAEKVNKCLEVINNKRIDVSDMINITVPFGRGPLSEAKNTFVIFDTPGSNVHTYAEHYDVLEVGMKNMSNGIPIYVAEFNSLDSCDNNELYERIKKISQIDSRFTMIIVNKADSANIKEDNFTEETEELILGQSVPKNLYSGGIYFVSSIMGLGSKQEGKFIDDHAAEFFEDNERKYSDPSSPRYKSLYKYNIMPEQIKNSIVETSTKADNKIFANSGLLAVEQEIVNFAEKYSAYDKCNQSEKYLAQIINLTQKEIEDARIKREATRKQLKESLEKDRKKLIDQVETDGGDLLEMFINQYDDNMYDSKKTTDFILTDDEVQMLEEIINLQMNKEHNLQGKTDNVKEAGSAIFDNFAQLGEKTFAEILKDFGDDVKETWESIVELKDAKMDSDEDTADELINVITDNYNQRVESSGSRLERDSKMCWEQNSDEVRRRLTLTVTNSSTLDNDKKEELADIIIKYRALEFDEHDFPKDYFEKKIAFFSFNKINTKKLTKTYNADYSNAMDLLYEQIKASHEKSFINWLMQLVDKIRENIVDYSPELTAQSQKIAEEGRIIEELERTKITLKRYSEHIIALMDWGIIS